ncbi:MAG TPA: sulfur carrier protein ThiS [Solirubrobacteraceae bacterium]|nr:sulfur carrier protein ThiS [Solirubrobacteraceae bacterium]
MILLNGRPSDVPPGETLAAVLARLGLSLDARGVAIAVDDEVVPRSRWETHTLADGARVEVLTAIQGG